MDQTTNPPARVEQSDVAQEFRAFKPLFYTALFGLIIMGVGVNVYLGKQMRLARAQLYAQQRSAEESERMVRNFVTSLQSFTATNRDFQPVFDKYRSVFSNYTGVASQPKN